MQQIVIYILCAVGGGVVAVIAFLVTLRMLSREASSTTISFGPRVVVYKHVELLAYDKRPGGIYVKYKNTGDKTLTTVIFDIRIFDGEGNLVDQFENTLYQSVPAGTTEEGIMKAVDYRGFKPVDLDGKKIEVRVKNGYIE